MAQDFSAGDVLEHVQLNNLLLAAKTCGVLDGLAVSEDSPVGMDVDVASGNCYIDCVRYIELSTRNIGLASAHATKYRKDLIIYDSSANNPAMIQGDDHDGGTSDPIYPPDIPSGDILLAIVNVDAGVSSISNADIQDCRAIINPAISEFFACDELLASDDPEESTASTTYVKLKEFEIKAQHISGILRIKFDLKTNSVNKTAYGRIYKNGVAIGSERPTDSGAYITMSADISGWSPNDTIQLYVHAYTPGGYTAYVENFRVYGGTIPIIE